MVFCAVPIVSKNFPKFKYAWILFAGLVAFSRVYLGLHFLSDVIVGGVLGYLIGVLVIRLEEKKKFEEDMLKREEELKIRNFNAREFLAFSEDYLEKIKS